MKQYKVENQAIYNPLKMNGMNITKDVRDYKNNADKVNRKAAKENLRKAKKSEADGNIPERNSYLKNAALNFTDAAEKYIKAIALIEGREAKHTHSFAELYKLPSSKDILTEIDVAILDRYSNKTNRSSHTELGYGNCQPTMYEVEQLEAITDNLYEIVDEKMSATKYTRCYLDIIDGNCLTIYEDDDYYIANKDK